MILWLLITFWSNVGVIILASRGHLGAGLPQGTVSAEEMVKTAMSFWWAWPCGFIESGLERDSVKRAL